MYKHVEKSAKKARARKMIAQGKEQGLAFHQRLVGTEQSVLWEQVIGAQDEGLRWVGYTDNYVRVNGVGPAGLFNQITPLIIESATTDGVTGRIVTTVAAD